MSASGTLEAAEFGFELPFAPALLPLALLVVDVPKPVITVPLPICRGV